MTRGVRARRIENEGILRRPWIEDVVLQVISSTESVPCDRENFRWKADVSDGRVLHSRILGVRTAERRVVLSDGQHSIQSVLSRLCVANLDPRDLGYTFENLGGAVVVPVEFFIHVRRSAPEVLVELYITQIRVWGYDGPSARETPKPIGKSRKLTAKLQSLHIRPVYTGGFAPLKSIPGRHPFTAKHRDERVVLDRFNDRHSTPPRNTEPKRTLDDPKQVRASGSMGSDTASEEDPRGLKPLAIVNSGPERSTADKVADHQAPGSVRFTSVQIIRRGSDPRSIRGQTSQDESSDVRRHRGDTHEAREDLTGLEDARQGPHLGTPSRDDVQSHTTPPTRDGERRKLRSSAHAQPSVEVPASEGGGVETRSRRSRIKGSGKFSVRFEVDGERANTSRSTEEPTSGSVERLTLASRVADDRELDPLTQREPLAADRDMTQKLKPIDSTEGGHDPEDTLSTPSIEKAKPVNSTETGHDPEARLSMPSIQDQNPVTHEIQHDADIEAEAMPTQVSQRLVGARVSGETEAATRTHDSVDGPRQEKAPARTPSSHPGVAATELAGSVAYGPNVRAAATEFARDAVPEARDAIAKPRHVPSGPGQQPVGTMPGVRTPGRRLDDAALLEQDKRAMNDPGAQEDEIPDSAEQDKPETSDRGTLEEEVDIPCSFPELAAGNGLERVGPRSADSDASTQAPLDKPRADRVQTEENVQVGFGARLRLGSPEAGRETAENSRLTRADDEETPRPGRFAMALKRAAKRLDEPSPIVERDAEFRPIEARARRDVARPEQTARASHNGPSTRAPKAGGDPVESDPDKTLAHPASLRGSRRLERGHGSVHPRADYRDEGRFRVASNRASHSDPVVPDPDEISRLPERLRGPRPPVTGHGSAHSKDDNHETERFSVYLKRASNVEPSQFAARLKSLSTDVGEHSEPRFSLSLKRTRERLRRQSLAVSPLASGRVSKLTTPDTEPISRASEGSRRTLQSDDDRGVGSQTKRDLEASLAAYSPTKRRRRGASEGSRELSQSRRADLGRAVHEENDSKFSTALISASKKRQQCIVM